MTNRLWRGSLIASLCVNSLAVSLVGYSHLSHLKPVAQKAEKPAPTRLVEIEELKTAKLANLEKTHSSNLDQPDETGDKGDPGDSSGDDADTGSKAEKPAKRQRSLIPVGHAAKKGKSSAPSKINIHSNMRLTAKINLPDPKPRIVHVANGVIDLSKAHITMELHADPSKVPAKFQPNKYIGKNKVEIRLNGARMLAKCVGSIGGNTVYGGMLKIILGPGITISGTKYCMPGSGGLPGGSSGNFSNSSGASGAYNGENAPSNLSYSPEMMKALSQTGGSSESGDKGTSNHGGKGKGGESKNGSGGAGTGGAANNGENNASLNPSSAGPAPDALDASQDPGQAALAANYAAYAKGPLHGLDDQKFKDVGIGLDTGRGPYNAQINALHLPETHGDPGDRARPGSPSGSANSHGKSDSYVVPDKIPFNPDPISVGSHSEQGTIPWGPDSPKHPKEFGLQGAYYIGRDFQHYQFTRRDKNIDYTWTGMQVDPRLPMGKPFSVRWTGFLKPRYSELYTIYTTSDDDVRLFIDGKLLIQNWNIHPATEDVIQIPLEAGKEYPIRVEYFEQTGLTKEVIKLYWESPGQPKEYIPEKCLIPTKTPN